ncbi:MAG: dienelactone hydrolase family protein [Fibrobacter sp.]|nr:dienelactone hydrolase family protein [Fibrobacter sp.]
MFGKNKLKKILISSSIALMGLTGVAVADNINVNGTSRNMLVYAPKNIEKNRPLIIQMHGYNQDAAYQKNAAKWEPVADTGRFVVVFPNGQNKAWDTGGDKDLNFIKAIINEMNNKYGIDKKRVYVSGFSMGGMMSYVVANKMSDMIAAIAPVSGGGGPSSAKRAMPIMHTHGTTDDVVNYNNTVNTLKSWVPFNKCSSNSKVTKPYPASKPGSAASLEVWSGCSDGVEIRLLTIAGKGHWYSMDEAVSVNTSVEIWNFVKRYSLDGPMDKIADTTKTEPPKDTSKTVTPKDTSKTTTPADTGKTVTPKDTSKTTTPADTGKVVAPADSGKAGFVTTLRFNTSETLFSVYNLVGKRLGFIEIIENDVPNMSKTMKNAGFGKGVYILRSKNRAFMVPVDR